MNASTNTAARLDWVAKFTPPAHQALDRTQQLRLAILWQDRGQDDRALDAFWLSVDVWRCDDRRKMARVEILLGCGGPSDGVEIDEHHNVTYWTTDTPTGKRAEVLLPDAAADHWLRVTDPLR